MAMQQNLHSILTMAKIKKSAFEQKIPIHATFELTPRCGFNCQMCYVHLSKEEIPNFGKELTGDQWLDVAKQTQEMGVLSLCITGGDPLLHPDFKEIWIGLSRMGFKRILQTNASLITDEILELFEDYPPDLIKITLYGSNDEVYKRVCGIENGFDKVDAGIKKLQEKGYPIQLVTTFTKLNKEDAQNIARYAKENQLPWYHSSACYPSLRGAKSKADECAIDFFSPDCTKEMADLWTNLPAQKDDLPIKKCQGYGTEFNISWNGNMIFCLFVEEPKLSVLDSSLEECWRMFLEYCEHLRWPEECYICEVRDKCRRCLAHLACLNGGLNKVNKKYCEQVKRMLAQAEN